MSKTVLVTGAGGFAGSRLCRHLVERGDRVRALLRPSGSDAAVDGLPVEIVRGDLGVDGGIPAEALKGCGVVYHIAALYRQESATRAAFENINVRGAERLLDAALRAGVARFVHCSTAGVHGDVEHPPADETAPFRPGDWYQETKLEGERRALEFGKQHGLAVSVVRPTAIYGPGEQRFLKLFRSIYRGVFVMIGDGTPLYHFVHVDDLARGFVLAAEKDEAIGEAFIVGGPEYLPIRRIVELIAEALRRPPPRIRIPIWPVMTAARLCKGVCAPLGIAPPLYPRRLDFFRNTRAFTCAKARENLGYEPVFGVRDSLVQMADWYREHGCL